MLDTTTFNSWLIITFRNKSSVEAKEPARYVVPHASSTAVSSDRITQYIRWLHQANPCNLCSLVFRMLDRTVFISWDLESSRRRYQQGMHRNISVSCDSNSELCKSWDLRVLSLRTLWKDLHFNMLSDSTCCSEDNTKSRTYLRMGTGILQRIKPHSR